MSLKVQVTSRVQACGVLLYLRDFYFTRDIVERSFSQLKNIFTDKGQSFTEDNLSKMVVSHCFYSRNS